MKNLHKRNHRYTSPDDTQNAKRRLLRLNELAPSRLQRVGWAALRSERGDVPGWVLVTVMTAGLVTAIWVLADTQLKAVLEHAMATLGAK